MKKGVFLALLVSLAIAAFLSPFASTSPDGLERVAEDKGFLHLSEGKQVVKSPMPDYVMPGVKNETTAGSLAGVAGTLITFAVMYGVGKIYIRKSRRVGGRQ
ncbi:PDGLE domain-containing protein [Phosphitispora fastidiosa]|uniref:PDGLE domain-containing protein n=1 Tax=Phosphitispora fastidiosa TaxID=2837202 RepID=UPI001E4CCA83|nr:PDGLE domain-containing protein [Phosphitispora fastidiosa]MBU7005860.1 cobalt/nickel transport protein [Phosphitispora fastidiosa]